MPSQSGYLYLISSDQAGSVTNNIIYAAIYANGALGAWQSASSGSLFTLQPEWRFGAAAYGGYLFYLEPARDQDGATAAAYYDAQSVKISPAGVVRSVQQLD